MLNHNLAEVDMDSGNFTQNLVISKLQENPDLNEGFIQEDGDDQVNLINDLDNQIENEETFLKDITNQDVKMIDEQQDVIESEDFLIDLNKNEKLLKLLDREKEALEQPKKKIEKYNLIELKENIARIYEKNDVILSKKNKKKKNKK